MTERKATPPHIVHEPTSRAIDNAMDLAKMVMDMSARSDPFHARYAFKYLVSNIPYLWGWDLKKMAMGDSLSPTAPKSEQMLLLADRLSTLCGESPPDDVQRAIDDIRAMAKGDEPRYLTPAPREGNFRTNQYRLSRYQLNALEWEKLLVFYGNKPGEVQSTVGVAFGCGWDTIRKWRPTIEIMLGAEYVEKCLERASRGISLLLPPFKSGDDVLDLINKDGAAYLKELAKQ